MGGVYSLNEPGHRLDRPQDAERFYPDVDGNFTDGIPGNPGDPFYLRPEGYWDGGKNWSEILRPDASQEFLIDDPTGKSTDGLITEDGVVKTLLPPNSRHFILGPLVDGYVENHGYDNYSNIGYIQKDTRQFVLLARIQGQFATNLHQGEARVWDGSSGQLTIYNSNFTLAMAEWFRDQITANTFTKNVPYFYSGGVPQAPIGGGPSCPNCPPPMFGGAGPGTGPDIGLGAGGGPPSLGNPQTNGPSKSGGPDAAGAPFPGANPDKKPDKKKKKEPEEIAQVSPAGESQIDNMLLRSLERGDYGTGPDIQRQIDRLKKNMRNNAPGGGGFELVDAGGGTEIAGLRPDGTSGPNKVGDVVPDHNGTPMQLVPRPGYGYNQWVPVKKVKKNPKTLVADFQPKFLKDRNKETLTETRTSKQKKILREIKQPIKVKEAPTKYKMNFEGRYSAQNTPDKTASAQSDALVASRNTKANSWRTNDKYWSGYETTERMNVIHDRVGHGQQAWDKIIDEAREKNGWRTREMQEELNKISHERAMLKENPDYTSPFGGVEISTTEKNIKNFEKVNKIKKVISDTKMFNNKEIKPEYPTEPAQKPNPASFYKSLDPTSADSMPDTGNSEIDNLKNKAKKKAK